MTWPPMTRIFLGPRSSLNILCAFCSSKKPWCWIKAKVELSSFFWKHWSRGVVKLTYLHQFKSDSKLQSWLMRAEKFLSDHSPRSGSKPVRWRRKKILSLIRTCVLPHPFWPGLNYFRLHLTGFDPDLLEWSIRNLSTRINQLWSFFHWHLWFQ